MSVIFLEISSRKIKQSVDACSELTLRWTSLVTLECYPHGPVYLQRCKKVRNLPRQSFFSTSLPASEPVPTFVGLSLEVFFTPNRNQFISLGRGLSYFFFGSVH